MATADITWRDVQQLPDDGRRREAIEGDLYVTAAPSFRHQRICHRIRVALDGLLEAPGHGVIASSPVGVEFPETGEGVQPDLVFVSEERRGIIAEDGVRGAPDLIVEILSSSTEERDRGIKRELYERQGVGEYWVVDPEEEAVEVWRFEGSGSEEETAHERCADRLPVRLHGERMGEIDLEEVFSRGA